MMGMKAYPAAFLVFALFLLILPAAAFNVTSVSISPSGVLTPYTDVTVTMILSFPPPSSKGTFDSSHNLNFITDLSSQSTWDMTMYWDGVERPTVERSGSSIVYNGYSISQPPWINVTMTVVLHGIVSPKTKIGNISVITVQEIDAKTNLPIPNTSVSFPGTVAATAPATQPATQPPTTVPTTIPPTVATTVPTPSHTATPVITPTPAPSSSLLPSLSDLTSLQKLKSSPILLAGIIVVVLVIIGIIIILVARRTEQYDEEEEEYEEPAEYDDEYER